MAVGGYRFQAQDLRMGAAAGRGALAALPDQLSGHRLAGRALEMPAPVTRSRNSDLIR